MTAAPLAASADPLAIISGGGSIPPAVAQAAARSGRRVVVFALRGWADPAWVMGYPHHWIAVGQFGRLTRLMRREGCREVVFIGTLVRPALSQLRLDWGTVRALPHIWRSYRGGDNHLLSGMATLFEKAGFRLLPAHEVAPSILAPPGPLGANRPSARDEADIARALALLAAMGPFDVGQAAVVADGHVLAVEAAEGTDGMLARVAGLRQAGRIPTPTGAGLLVKAPKPGQDHRFDLPSIGPQTVDGVVQAGLAGIAVVAGGTITADPERLVRKADEAGIFIVGVPPQGSGG